MKQFISNRRKSKTLLILLLILIFALIFYIFIHWDVSFLSVFEPIRFEMIENLFDFEDWMSTYFLSGMGVIISCLIAVIIYYLVRPVHSVYLAKNYPQINELNFPKKSNYAKLVFEKDKLENTIDKFDYTLDEKEAEVYMELSDKRDEIQKMIDGFEPSIVEAQKQLLYKSHNSKKSSKNNPYDKEFVYKAKKEGGEVEVASVERGFVENKGIQKDKRSLSLDTPNVDSNISKFERFKEILRKLPRVNGIGLIDKIDAPTDILRTSDLRVPTAIKNSGAKIIRIHYKKPKHGNVAKDVEITFKLGKMLISKKFDYVFKKSFEKKLLESIKPDDIALPVKLLAESPAILTQFVKAEDFKLSPKVKGKLSVSNFTILDIKQKRAKIMVVLRMPNYAYDPKSSNSFEYVTRSIQKIFLFKKTDFEESVKFLKLIKTINTSMISPTELASDLVVDTSDITDAGVSISSINYNGSFKKDSKEQTLKIIISLGNQEHELIRKVTFKKTFNESLLDTFNSKEVNLVPRGSMPKVKADFEPFINKSLVTWDGIKIDVKKGTYRFVKKTNEHQVTIIAKAGKAHKQIVFKFTL